MVFGLEWSVNLTFLVFRTTCNTKVGTGNLSNILVEVYFMHLVCTVFACGQGTKFRATGAKNTSISDLTNSFCDTEFATIWPFRLPLQLILEPKYDQIGQSIQEWTKESLLKTAFNWRGMVCHNIPSNFLKTIFHNYYLVHSWILCPKWFWNDYFIHSVSSLRFIHG